MFAVISLPLSIDLLTQITALSPLDFIIPRSQSDSETRSHCWSPLAPVLVFPLSVPLGTLMDKSRHSFSVQCHYGKQGNPVVGALLWESGNLRIGPDVAVNCVTEQSGLDLVQCCILGRCFVSALVDWLGQILCPGFFL